MSNQFDNIPSELRACKQWVNYKLQKKTLITGEIKYTKPPVNSACNNIDITDQKNYLNFNDAVANLEKNKNIAGIGFVFNSVLGAESYVGIDLDNVFKDGIFTELATDILNLMCSYSEMSISGTGVHIIVKGKINSGGKRIAVGDSNIEVYRNNAYFTVSGVHIPNTPTTIKNRQEELKTLYEKYFKVRDTGTQKGDIKPDLRIHQNTDNQTYLENGIKHGKRLNSFLQGYRATNDESQNDYILLVELAYWCNKDIDLMLNTFYNSNYFNSKDNYHKRKALKKNYINSTAKKAINNTVSTAKETEYNKTKRYDK